MSRFLNEYTASWVRREGAKAKKVRARRIARILARAYPKAGMILRWHTPVQLAVAVMLSAQCTDKKVNEVTEPLFQRFKTARDFAAVSQKELEKLIRSTGFYRAKAHNIRTMASQLLQRHGGKLPRTMQDLTALRGIARKTANVILGNAYNVVEGIAVDTHVGRIAQRLGLTASADPVAVERDLMALFPKSSWFRLTYLFIDHGRALCAAQRPRCDQCPLAAFCPSRRPAASFHAPTPKKSVSRARERMVY